MITWSILIIIKTKTWDSQFQKNHDSLQYIPLNKIYVYTCMCRLKCEDFKSLVRGTRQCDRNSNKKNYFSYVF